MRNSIKAISLVCILVASNAIAMKQGKKALSKKRERAEQVPGAVRDWEKTDLKLILDYTLYPNNFTARHKKNRVWDVIAHTNEDLNELVTPEQKPILYFAVTKGNLEAARLLLAHGAQPNIDLGYESGVTLLHIACKLGELPMVELLLEHGANPEAQTRRGMTPRRFAEYYSQQVHNQQFVEAYDALIARRAPQQQPVAQVQQQPVPQVQIQPREEEITVLDPFAGSSSSLVQGSSGENEHSTEIDEANTRRVKRLAVDDVLAAYALHTLMN